MFVILVPLAIWLYTLIFALSSLWFAHYCLAALQALRAERALAAASVAAPAPALIDLEAVTLANDTFSGSNTSR
jgi:hypothetical protein